MNFDFITDNMAVGTYPETGEDAKRLVDVGVTHILNVREVNDLPAISGMFEYCWNPTPDWTPQAAVGLEPKPVKWFESSLLFWDSMRTFIGPASRLFIHCSAGVNRSATTAWMYLRSMQLKGKDCDFIIDSHRLIATFGTFFDHPWRVDAERALVELGYIDEC